MDPTVFTIRRLAGLEGEDVEHDEKWKRFVIVMSENARAYAEYVLKYIKSEGRPEEEAMTKNGKYDSQIIKHERL